MTTECIFVGRPPDCATCLDPLILTCVQNRRHLILTEDGKRRVIDYVTREVSNPERYKTKSGEEQRKG